MSIKIIGFVFFNTDTDEIVKVLEDINSNNLDVEDNRSFYDKSGSSYIISKEDDLEKSDYYKKDFSSETSLSVSPDYSNKDVSSETSESSFIVSENASILPLSESSSESSSSSEYSVNSEISFFDCSEDIKEQMREEKLESDPVYKRYMYVSGSYIIDIFSEKKENLEPNTPAYRKCLEDELSALERNIEMADKKFFK